MSCYIVGHQKKMMLAIDRLKRINGSLRRLSSNKQSKQSTVDSPCVRHVSRLQSDDMCMTCTATSTNRVPQISPTVHYNGSVPAVHTPQVSAYDNVTPRCSGSNLTTFMAPALTICTTAGLYQPTLNSVAEMSVVSREEMSRQTGQCEDPVWSHMSAVVTGGRARDSDGDVTPTNERRSLPARPMNEFNQGSIVTRPAAYVVPSPKPVAMVAAKAKPSQNGGDPTADMLQSLGISETAKSSGTNFSYGTLPRRFSQKRQLTAVNGDELYNSSYTDTAYENVACSSRSPASVLCLEQSKERIHTDANSNCRVVKKEPPVPPKRTHSFKTDVQLPIANMRASSGVPFTNSIPRATLASLCSNGEAFKSSAAGSTDLFDGTEDILNEVIERLERGGGSSTVRRNTGPRLGDWQDCRSSNDSSSGSEDSDSGLESRRSESNTSLDGTAGCGLHGSADMHTLPFANENVGTIKQRGSSSSKPSVVTSSESGSVELNSSAFTPTISNGSTALSASVTAAVS